MLQATEEVLDEFGVEGVTTVRIASRVGMSVGTLYRCLRDKNALVAAALERRDEAARDEAAQLAQARAREGLEDSIAVVVRQLVSAYAQRMPAMVAMSELDREAFHRTQLKRMAQASHSLLTRHQVPDPGPAAHVMTLSCNKVVKDAVRHAPESFADGRLERALCGLCLDFVHSV